MSAEPGSHLPNLPDLRDGAVVLTCLAIPESDDLIVLLDPDPDRRPEGVEHWHPFRNLVRVGPRGDLRWRATLIPGDTWKCFHAVEWADGQLRALAASYVCKIDPLSGEVVDAVFTK